IDLGSVDAYDHAVVGAIERRLDGAQEVGSEVRVSRPHLRYLRRTPVLTDLSQLARQSASIVAGEDVERLELGDLLAPIACYPLPLVVPADEPTRCVTYVEQSTEALSHGVTELLLPAHLVLDLEPLLQQRSQGRLMAEAEAVEEDRDR